MVLWKRRRLTAAGLIVAFVGLAVVWFIPNGFEETIRKGRVVCCGHEIDRGWLRTSLAAAGAVGGSAMMLLGLRRAASSRTHEPTAQ